jgi:hypothetical protein
MTKPQERMIEAITSFSDRVTGNLFIGQLLAGQAGAAAPRKDAVTGTMI